MTNPVARARRHVHTRQEHAAILPDYKLTFRAQGAGTVVPARFHAVHGVVMELASVEDWERLKVFETGYNFQTVQVQLYRHAHGNGEDLDVNGCNQQAEDCTVKAYLFSIEPHHPDVLPQERYLRVIAAGMRIHGVDDDFINDEILGVAYRPSRKPGHYLQFPTQAPVLPKIKKREYQKWAYQRNCFAVGHRVIQVHNLDLSIPLSSFVKNRLIGQTDVSWIVWETLLEPDLPACQTAADLTDVHRQWAEDQLCDLFQGPGISCTVIGILLSDKEQQQQQQPRCTSSRKEKSVRPRGFFGRRKLGPKAGMGNVD